jgi:H+/Cl- antiporter ClcA
LISYFGELPPDLTLCIGTGLISGFAPYLARLFVFQNIKLESDLSNLSLPKLLVCILIYALLSAGLHQVWYATMNLEDSGSLNHFLAMFIGDVLGSLLLISLIKSCLDSLEGWEVLIHNESIRTI